MLCELLLMQNVKEASGLSGVKRVLSHIKGLLLIRYYTAYTHQAYRVLSIICAIETFI